MRKVKLIYERAQLFGIDPPTRRDQASSDFNHQTHLLIYIL
jgi:hypothetical protein